MKRIKPTKTQTDDLDVGVFSSISKADLLDLAKRGKSSLKRRKSVQQKIAKLLDLDPEQEAEVRLREHDACIKAARKRVEQMRSAHLKKIKKAPPLIEQIQGMLSREEM